MPSIERPMVPVCLRLKIFPGHGSFRFKPRNSQANGTSRSPLEAIRSHYHITEADHVVLLEVTPSLMREVVLFFQMWKLSPKGVTNLPKVMASGAGIQPARSLPVTPSRTEAPCSSSGSHASFTRGIQIHQVVELRPSENSQALRQGQSEGRFSR